MTYSSPCLSGVATVLLAVFTSTLVYVSIDSLNCATVVSLCALSGPGCCVPRLILFNVGVRPSVKKLLTLNESVVSVSLAGYVSVCAASVPPPPTPTAACSVEASSTCSAPFGTATCLSGVLSILYS